MEWLTDVPCSIERNHEALQNVPLVRRWYRGRSNAPDDYPYRSHGQPFTAYASLMGCLFILVVANGAGLWSGWHEVPFLSAYLAVSDQILNLPVL